jgi:hypothetical protein
MPVYMARILLYLLSCGKFLGTVAILTYCINAGVAIGSTSWKATGLLLKNLKDAYRKAKQETLAAKAEGDT